MIAVRAQKPPPDGFASWREYRAWCEADRRAEAEELTELAIERSLRVHVLASHWSAEGDARGSVYTGTFLGKPCRSPHMWRKARP